MTFNYLIDEKLNNRLRILYFLFEALSTVSSDKSIRVIAIVENYNPAVQVGIQQHGDTLQRRSAPRASPRCSRRRAAAETCATYAAWVPG